jgi:hypothetical protein
MTVVISVIASKYIPFNDLSCRSVIDAQSLAGWETAILLIIKIEKYCHLYAPFKVDASPKYYNDARTRETGGFPFVERHAQDGFTLL